MVSGEFVSMTTLHQAIPDSTPAPIAWGTYASNPNLHFFLCHFVEVIDEVPDVETFTLKVADLHAKSSSPNGKYGFPVPTYMGQMAQYHAWTESWEEFFNFINGTHDDDNRGIPRSGRGVKRLIWTDDEQGGSSIASTARDRGQADQTMPRTWKPIFWQRIGRY